MDSLIQDRVIYRHLFLSCARRLMTIHSQVYPEEAISGKRLPGYECQIGSWGCMGRRNRWLAAICEYAEGTYCLPDRHLGEAETMIFSDGSSIRAVAHLSQTLQRFFLSSVAINLPACAVADGTAGIVRIAGREHRAWLGEAADAKAREGFRKETKGDARSSFCAKKHDCCPHCGNL
jgi:hypothetical protein